MVVSSRARSWPVDSAAVAILADPVLFKKGDQQCETLSQSFIQPEQVDRQMVRRPTSCVDVDYIGED